MFSRIAIVLLTSFGAVLPSFSQSHGRFLSITLSSSADIVIARADGKRTGRDPVVNQKYDEIAGAEVLRSPGREPVYDIPLGESAEPLTITIFGREQVKDAKLAITGPNFVFGVNGIPLAKSSVATLRVTPSGDMLEYSPHQPGSVPKIVLGIDPADSSKPSYVFEVQRMPLTTVSTIRVVYSDQRSLSFGDDSKQLAEYGINITRINADGTENTFKSEALRAKRSNHFEVDLDKWDGRTRPCLRADDEHGVRRAKCR